MRITKFKKGFTLAEVLITLMIIGVIAALTVPTLKVNAERKEFAAKISKTYSNLAQATKLLAQEAQIRYWDSTFVDSASQDCYAKRLNYLTKQTTGTDVKFYMQDGQTIETRSIGTKIEIEDDNAKSYGADPNDAIYGYFVVDVNGETKPNEYGYDRYVLLLVDEKGVLPSGYYDCDNDLFECAAKVIREGKSN